jgi:epoxyqueuosine reductase
VTHESHVESSGLKAKARELGFDLVGVCPAVSPPHYEAYLEWVDKGFGASMDYLRGHLPLKRHPSELLPNVRSVVAVALNYNQPNPVRPGEPRVARYALGRDYHKVIRSKLRRLSDWIRETFPNAECRPCVDSAPIMERDFGQLAGLGWFGKNTMLINSQRGSWFFLGMVLTTVEFETDEPAVGGCGSCRRCIEACPTGAIVFEQERWQVDARRCISYLSIEHEGPVESLAGWTFGCDICQEVCPFNEPRPSQPLRASQTEETDFLRRTALPPLAELADLPWDDWDRLTRGSALRRTGYDGLRRNALVNLPRHQD